VVLAVLALALGLVAFTSHNDISTLPSPVALATATATATATPTLVPTRTPTPLPVTPTLVPTPTAIPSATPAPTETDNQPEVGEKEIPVYPGAKRLNEISYSERGVTRVVYLSPDDYREISTWMKKNLEDGGWSEVSTMDNNGASVVLAKKGKYTLLGTLVGPKAHTNPNYDLLVREAKPATSDTIIALVVAAG
jgi:hypothetical protein